MNTNKKTYLLIVLFAISVFHLKAQEERYIGLFIYNFTKYFDWPENMKSNDFVIEVVGHQSVYEELIKVTANKKVGQQNIVIKNPSSAEAVGKCHIVFVGHWQSRQLQTILDKIGNQPSLIISEMEGLLEKGSAINFVIREGTIKFEMKVPNVSKHQIKTDPRIRELAYKVIE